MLKNIAQACELQAIIKTKQDKAEALNREIGRIRASYRGMSDSQLAEAVRDVAGMHREEMELKDYIAKAKAEVMAFYAPQYHTA